MKTFELTITTALASSLLVLAACSRQNDDWTARRDTAICADRSGRRLPDQNCGAASTSGGSHAAGGGAWYYLGRNSQIPPYGERASSGSFTRTAGATYFHAPLGTAMTRSAAISRGGFGSSARAFGGFGE